jgi:two-component system, NarL family, sensor histidine kinase UhpB
MIWILLSCLIFCSRASHDLMAQPGITHTIDSLQKLYQSSKEDTTRVYILVEIAENLFKAGQYPGSIDYLNKAATIVEKNNDKKQTPVVYNLLGRSYSELGDISRSLEYYYKGLRSAEKLGNKKAMAASYQFIGAIYFEQSDDSSALKNVLAASKINLETGNRFQYAQNLNSIGDIYLRQGRYADALTLYPQALKIYEEPGAPKWGIPWTISSIGTAYEGLGDSAIKAGNKPLSEVNYNQALNSYNTALGKWNTIGISGGIAELHYYLGKLYIKLNRIPEARKHLLTGLELSKESSSREMIGNSYLHLAKIDSLQGDYKNAFIHFRLGTLYRDSVYNAESFKKIGLYRTKYEIEKKEEEIKLLAAENKLKETVAEKQKQQKLFAYGALLLLVLSGGYSFYRYRIRKKTEVEQAKLKDRLHISQGLHDDIGSTLSSISVYSNVAQKLSEKNDKEQLIEMLAKIQETSSEMISEMNDIVWAIHPKNDSMEKIILRMESYAKPMLMTRNIQFKLEYCHSILGTQMEMEKRKNFYLVFKEAVNNAFKYSGCSEIATQLSNDNGRIKMTVKDNGAGFDLQKQLNGNRLTLSGNGIANIKMRAEEMKGVLKICSSAGEGTEVSLTVPIP